MIKQMAWNIFKNTGNIDSYLELVELENVEKNITDNGKKEEVKNKIKNKEDK